MNPEKYQQLIAKAQEASAVNAREQNDDDATKNGPGDQASPSPAAVPHTDGDEKKKRTPQKYKRKLAMAREAVAANAGDQNNEDATINGPGDVAHGDAPASVASASPSRENDEDKDVSTQSSQKYEKYKKKVAGQKESQDDSTKLPALPDGAMSPAALADRPPPAQTSNRKAPSPVENPNSAQTYSSGATVISNPLSAESVEPTPTLRQPSVKLYATAVAVVEPSAPTAAPSAPITDPISDALKVVDRFSSMYLRLGPATMSRTVLQNALTAAMARCDDAIDGPPADLPPLEDASLGDALEFLAGVANAYMEFGSGGVPVPIVREALAKAMVRCEEMEGAEAGAAPVKRKKFFAGPRGKKFIIIGITVFVGIAVIVGFPIVTLLGKKNTDVEQPTADTDDNSFSAELSAKPSASLSSGPTPLLLTVPPSSRPVPSPSFGPAIMNPSQPQIVSSDGENTYELDASNAPSCCAEWGMEKYGIGVATWPFVSGDGSCGGGSKYGSEQEVVDVAGISVGLCLIRGYYKSLDYSMPSAKPTVAPFNN